MSDATPDFTLEVDGLDAGTLRVLQFEGAEGLNEIWRYDLQLTSRDPALEFADIVGKKATFTMSVADGDRVSVGIISRFEQHHHGRVLTYYSARLVPKLFALTLSKRSRVFQDMATPDILKKVLAGGGISGGDQVAFSLNASYPPRKYCVQYRETDFDFCARLMEEEGITYFFPQADGKQAMTLTDKASSHQPVEGDADVPYREEDTGMSGADEIRHFALRRAMRSGTVRLREIDFIKSPTKALEALKKGNDEAALEVYDFPGEFPDTSVGTRLAQVRLEEERAERDLATGASNCKRLVAGFRFNLVEHPRDSMNAEYLLTSVTHIGRQPMAAEEDQVESDTRSAYKNEFRCIPAATQYRPPRLTPRPVIDGVQTAIVVGEGEIDPDKHGRVKVRFPWDLEDKASTWVRVSQGWGGAGWGGMFIPRIGHEVIVEFIEGDPDRPIITGRVYNGANPPPYPLPDKKTVSTIMSNSSPGGGGSNELRFEDAAGSEEIYAHAQKDWNAVIENDRTRMVGHDEKIHVKNDRTTKVDHDKSETVGNNKTKKIGGNEKEDITGSRSITVGGNHTEMITGALGITVGAVGAITIAGAGSISIGGVGSFTAGGNLTEAAGGKMDVSSAKDYTLSAGENGSITTNKKLNMKVGDAMALDVEKDRQEAVGKKMKVAVKDEYGLDAKKVTIEAKDEIVLMSGSAKISLKKNGDITIEGGKINIKGSGDVIVKGSKIAQN